MTELDVMQGDKRNVPGKTQRENMRKGAEAKRKRREEEEEETKKIE